MFVRFLKLLIATVISLLLISLFSVIYSYSGVHITNTEHYTDYKWEPKQFFSTMNEGYSWFTFDEHGFNNKFPYKDKDSTPLENRVINVLLMGSSHMEAINIQPKKNTGYLLNTLLPEYYTYNIGISGHNIYNCFKNMPFAVSKLTPKDYVVLETSTISFLVDNMSKVNNGTFPTIKSYDKGILYVMQKTVPGIKLLYKKIEEWRKLDSKKQAAKQQIVYDNQYIRTVNEFLGRAGSVVKNSGAKLIVAYHPNSKIDRCGQLLETTDKRALEIIKTACKNNDVIFVDCTDAAKKLYDNKHVLIHGFCNSAVGVGHLNESGHKLMATEIAKAIKAL